MWKRPARILISSSDVTDDRSAAAAACGGPVRIATAVRNSVYRGAGAGRGRPQRVRAADPQERLRPARPAPNMRQAILLGILLLLGFAVARETMDGFANWLTWRTRIGLQYALLEATIGKLHRMPLRVQRSEGIGAIMTRLDRSIQGFTQRGDSDLIQHPARGDLPDYRDRDHAAAGMAPGAIGARLRAVAGVDCGARGSGADAARTDAAGSLGADLFALQRGVVRHPDRAQLRNGGHREGALPA